jgi:hypothetical protein
LLLRRYVDDQQEVRARAARVRIEMIAHEVRVLAMDGFSPRLTDASP